MSRLARDSLYTVGAFFLTALFNYGFSVVMGRLLPPAEFGRLSVALTLYMLGATILVAGIPWVVARELARLGQQAQPQGAPLLKTALVGNSLLAVALSIAMFAAFAAGWLGLEAAYAPLLGMVALAWLFMGPQAVLRNALRGLLRLDAFAAAQVLEAASGLVIGALAAGLGWGAVGGLSGQTFSILLTLVFGLWLLRKWRFWRTPGWASLQVLRVGMAFFIGTAGITYLMNLDVMGVKWFTAAQADLHAGLFQVAATLARPPAYVALALANAALPHLARHAAQPQNAHPMARGLWAAFALGLLPFHAALAFYADLIVGLLFPPAYAPAGAYLRTLAWCTLPLDLLFLTVAALQAHGQANRAAVALLAGLASEFLTMRALVPRLGPLGAGYSLMFGGVLALCILIPGLKRTHLLHPHRDWVKWPAWGGTAVLLLWLGQAGGWPGMLLSLVILGFGYLYLGRHQVQQGVLRFVRGALGHSASPEGGM